jgi:hypothetical protein
MLGATLIISFDQAAATGLTSPIRGCLTAGAERFLALPKHRGKEVARPGIELRVLFRVDNRICDSIEEQPPGQYPPPTGAESCEPPEVVPWVVARARNLPTANATAPLEFRIRVRF